MNRTVAVCCFCLAATLAASLASASPKVGDTYESVIAAKGKPVGSAGAGSLAILNYEDEVITLKDGIVTSVRPADEATTTVPDRKVTEAEKRRAAASTSASTTTTATAVSSGAWTTDYDNALATARSQNRKVFLFFTGSDWCGWCVKLNKDVLATPEFTAYANDKLVLVDLDFPRRKAQPAEERARNEELAEKYGITGFPTVIVLSPQGKIVGKLGYPKGGLKAFLDALKRM